MTGIDRRVFSLKVREVNVVSAPMGPDSPQGCSQIIKVSIEAIFARLQSLADEVRRFWEAREEAQCRPVSRDLAQLRPRIDALLLQTESCVGAGVVLQPGTLADRQLYMEWRRQVGEGKLLSLSLNLDESSANCFHYQDKPWFRVPRDHGTCTVAGPYVDLYCTGVYALTFSLPIVANGRFIGVAGVDLPMRDFERQLARHLMRLPQEALLVSAEGRVVASNTADWTVGDLVGRLPADPGCTVLSLGEQAANWSLICLPESGSLAA